MKKSLMIAIAGLLALGSTAADASGIYIGIGAPSPVYYAPPAPTYYAPRPVYYAPRPVAYYPAPVFVNRGWHGHKHDRHNHNHGYHRGGYGPRGYRY